MRKIALTAALLSLSIFVPPASADVTPTPTPTSTLSPAAQYVLDLEKYREDFKSYKIARTIYDRQLVAIAIEFSRALDRATRDAKLVGKSEASKAYLSVARAQAATARDQAVAALGEPPVPPVPPVAPLPPQKQQKSEKPDTSNKFKGPNPRP
jgi:hypothetical protein